jgi:AcrR family transcriptional regulator
MATQAARRQSTRQAILRAAAKLFRHQGYDETSVDLIVETANVAKGTFYQYFQTKIEVAVAVVEAERAEMLTQLEAKLDAGADALDLAAQTYQDFAQWFEAHRHLARPLLLHTLQTHGDPAPSSTRALLTRLLSAAQQQGRLRQDIPAETLAAVAASSIVPMVFYWTEHGQPGQLPQWFAVAWKLHLEGSLPRPAAGSAAC